MVILKKASSRENQHSKKVQSTAVDCRCMWVHGAVGTYTRSVLQCEPLDSPLPLLKHARASIWRKIEFLHHHVFWNADLLPQVQTFTITAHRARWFNRCLHKVSLRMNWERAARGRAKAETQVTHNVVWSSCFFRVKQLRGFEMKTRLRVASLS